MVKRESEVLVPSQAKTDEKAIARFQLLEFFERLILRALSTPKRFSFAFMSTTAKV